MKRIVSQQSYALVIEKTDIVFFLPYYETDCLYRVYGMVHLKVNCWLRSCHVNGRIRILGEIVQFIFKRMDEADARVIQTWRYEEAYSVYNWGEDISEMLDLCSPYYAVRNKVR